jgi:hypothetical protein
MKSSDRFEDTILSALPPALMDKLKTLFPHEGEWKNLKWILEDLADNGRIDGQHGYGPEVMRQLASLTLSGADAEAIAGRMRALNTGLAGSPTKTDGSSDAGGRASGASGDGSGPTGSSASSSGAGAAAGGSSGTRSDDRGAGRTGGSSSSWSSNAGTASGPPASQSAGGPAGPGAGGATLAGYAQPIASWTPAGLATESQLQSYEAACDKAGVFATALQGQRTPSNDYRPGPDEVRQYKAFADQTERALGLPKGLLNGQIIQESNYNPRETKEDRDPTLGLGQVRVSDVRRIADRGLLPPQFRAGGGASDSQVASALLDGRFNILMMGLQHIDKQLELGPQGLAAKLGYGVNQARWNYFNGSHASGSGGIDTSVLSYTDNKQDYLDKLKAVTVPLITGMGDAFLKSGYAGNNDYWDPRAGLRNYAGQLPPDMQG